MESFRFWEQKLKCLVRTAVFSDGDGEVDLHAVTVLRKLCSPNVFSHGEDYEKNRESSGNFHAFNDEIFK